MAGSSQTQVGIQWGLFLGAAYIVYSLIMHYSGLQDVTDLESKSNLLSSLLLYPILFAFFFFGIKAFKTENEGMLTLGEGMTTAMFIGLVSGIISAIFTYIFMKYMIPDIAETMKETVLNQQQGEVQSEKEVEMLGNIMGAIFSPTTMAFMTLISRIFSALLFGLIASLILRNDK